MSFGKRTAVIVDDFAAAAGARDAKNTRRLCAIARVRAQPTHGGFAVFDLRGPDGVLAEAIIDRRHGLTLIEHRRWGLASLVAHTKCAPVGHHHRGEVLAVNVSGKKCAGLVGFIVDIICHDAGRVIKRYRRYLLKNSRVRVQASLADSSS